MSDKSGCQYDVPVTKTKGDGYTGHPGVSNPPYTINNPACLRINNPPADVAGGYDANGRKWYWYAKKGNQYGEINLTKGAAELYWDPSGKSTSADIIVSFPYGLHMGTLEKTGDNMWSVTVFNTTPYIAKNVKLRYPRTPTGRATETERG
jgi:hypothetical protein